MSMASCFPRLRRLPVAGLALLLAGVLPAALAQPTKDGLPRRDVSNPIPAQEAQVNDPRPSLESSPPQPASPGARVTPLSQELALLQRANQQLTADLDKAKDDARTLSATNKSLARELITTRRELILAGRLMRMALGLAMGLIVLPPLLYLWLIQRRLHDLRDLQEQLAREHERQMQDHEALLRTLRGSLQRLDARPMAETREAREDKVL